MGQYFEIVGPRRSSALSASAVARQALRLWSQPSRRVSAASCELTRDPPDVLGDRTILGIARVAMPLTILPCQNEERAPEAWKSHRPLGPDCVVRSPACPEARPT